MTGIVKRWMEPQGYGFIESESGKTCFVHWSYINDSALRKNLETGQVVEFNLYETPRGWEALDVRKI